jgi:hypothetical protein
MSTRRGILAQQADALLRHAQCDIVSGASKDRQYCRDARAKAKRLSAHRRAKTKRLGKFGAASPVRHVTPDGR